MYTCIKYDTIKDLDAVRRRDYYIISNILEIILQIFLIADIPKKVLLTYRIGMITF